MESQDKVRQGVHVIGHCGIFLHIRAGTERYLYCKLDAETQVRMVLAPFSAKLCIHDPWYLPEGERSVSTWKLRPKKES